MADSSFDARSQASGITTVAGSILSSLTVLKEHYHKAIGFGFADRCEARLAAPQPASKSQGYAPGPAFGQMTRGRARTTGEAQEPNPVKRRGKPRPTSGGEAVGNPCGPILVA